MDDRRIHTPVLLERCHELLAPAVEHDGAVLVDATLGMGGHAEAFLGRFPSLRVVGIDRDQDALDIARRRLSHYADRIVFVHAVYDGIADACAAAGVPRVDAILFDLGVSSLQLDADARGFSYARDAPLDMRMDASETMTAARILREYDEARLRGIFERYGEEKLAGRYARAIVAHRVEEPIERSGQLVRVLEDATPAAARRAGHVAKRVFQALRIEVNQELAALERALPAAMAMLPIGGRILVLSYQSLEDRIVKRAFSAASSGTAPPGLPVETEQHAPRFRLLVRGAEQASAAERSANPRAASVRLRAAERVRAAA